MIFGELLFAGCCAFYLVWWSVAFHPQKKYAFGLKVALFVPTAALGIAGFWMLASAVSQMCASSSNMHVWPIIVGAIIVYALLLFLTYKLLKRQVTIELLLIVLWTALQICVVYSLAGTGVWGTAEAVLLVLVIVVAAAVSLVCYLRYYKLPPIPAFRIAMVPLILFGLVMCLMAALIAAC